MALKLLICFAAGCGAGLGTGFAGLSAAAVISPLLITFLGMDAYSAVGIALASDVLASAVSAWIYGKHGNLDLKNGLVMMGCVLVFTVAGSWLSSRVATGTMSTFSVAMTLILGIRFLVKPVMVPRETALGADPKKRLAQSVVFGALIGSVCGFVGAGGGMMLLMVLTAVMGYDLKTAVGTSVLIMSATALTGAVSHFAIGGAPQWDVLILCVLFTLIWARIAARIANRAAPETLNRVTGIVLVVLGVAVLGFQLATGK